MIICICGKSGSGKSTIAKRIQKERPNSIHIDIDKIGRESHNDASVKEKLINTFGEVLSKNGLTQLRIAETEKYAHVTFFFDGTYNVNTYRNKKKSWRKRKNNKKYSLEDELEWIENKLKENVVIEVVYVV